MEEYEPLLQAQIAQYLGSEFEPVGPLKSLLDAVNRTYRPLLPRGASKSAPESPPTDLPKHSPTRLLWSLFSPKLKTPDPNELVQNEERFAAWFEATFEGIVFHDHGIILDVNPAALQMLGYRKEEVLGTSAFNRVAGNHRRKVMASLQNKSNEFYKVDLIRKDGTLIHAEIRGKDHFYRGKSVRMVSLRDGTRPDQPLVREETNPWQGHTRPVRVGKTSIHGEKSEKSLLLGYSLGVEFANDLIYQCDPYGHCTYVNPAGARVLGYEGDELLGKHFSEVVNVDYCEMVTVFYRNQFTSRTRDTYLEFVFDTKTGGQVWVGQNVHALLDGPRIAGFQAVARDITERKRAGSELVGANQLAEEFVRANDQFLSVMSHEPGTPLNAVIEKNRVRELDERLPAVKISANNLVRLIDHVPDCPKTEPGVAFERIPFDLDGIFRGVSQGFGFAAAQKDIKLLFTTQAGMPDVLVGDPVRLQQILTNLVGNAVEFTEQGHVEMSAETVGETARTVTVRFDVTDTGIPAEQVPAIFERFTPVNAHLARQYGGTGRGISTTRQLIELQGGEIRVNSQLGVGSTFAFSLTFGKTEENTLPKRAVLPKNGQARRGKVLLVEDNRMNRLLINAFLCQWNIAADVASDGYEALEKLRTTSYELVLMDLQMPGMDGFETTRRLRQLDGPTRRDVPVLAITATVFADAKTKVSEAGMNDLIVKPFDPQKLRDQLFRYLPAQPGKSRPAEAPPISAAAPSSPDRYTNLDYLGSISIHDAHFLERIIRVFLHQTPEFVERAREACRHRDWKTLYAIIHKMKATTATVGIARLTPVFEQMESALLSGGVPGTPSRQNLPPTVPPAEFPTLSGDQIAALVDQVAEVCERAYQELEEHLALMAE
ncbi:MAG: PAS domain S-box protein [Ferruginibacter sp.]|nr:PAS domain S-box protein [Cytophagales bacterium]